MLMDRELIDRLLELNRAFYDGYAQSFSSTRFSVQPGIRSLLPRLLETSAILDLGCGNGNLAKALHQAGYEGSYLGLDNSQGLLDEAKKAVGPTSGAAFDFRHTDLARDLDHRAFNRGFDAVTCFAVVHHFPEPPFLSRFFSFAAGALKPGGSFYLSAWQVKSSRRLKNRIQPWSLVGLDETRLDDDDLLLDWRADPAQEQLYRYVRHYSAAALRHAGSACGFSLASEFYSDGREGDLALYQVWQLPL